MAVAAVPGAVVTVAATSVWADPSPSPSPVTLPTTTTSGVGGSTTTRPVAGGSTTTSSPTSTTGTTSTTSAPGGGDSVGLVGTVPDWAQREIDAYPITPPGTSDPLIAALAPLHALGLSTDEIDRLGFGRFPIAGHAAWRDSFLEPRFDADGTFKFHHAIDIPAGCGTPERAPDEGILTQGSDPGGGNTVVITEPDGTYMYMAHLDSYAPGTASGQLVHIGDVVGFVGATGAATGCHLHLEIHPQGGDPIDPKPFVDAWYADALAEAPVLVAAVRADRGLPSPDAIASRLSQVGAP